MQNGISVFVIGRRELDSNDDEQNNLSLIQVDLTSTNAIDTIKQKLNNIKLDYLVFSAATEMPLKGFQYITNDEYDYAFLLNLKIPFFLTKELLNNLNPSARLLYLTSRLSSSPEVGSLIYCMSKSAIEIFSLGINKELNGKILSSTIIPGIVDTEMQKRLRGADPKMFPHAYTYQNMRPNLQSIKLIGESIAYHLCDTDDEAYSHNRVYVSEVAFK